MLKRLLIALAIALWPAISIAAEADNYVVVPTSVGAQWQPVSPSNPMPVSLSGTSSGGITPVVGGSAISSQVLKAAAGSLYGVYANCTAACWLMVFNSTTAPSNGSTTAGTASGNMQDCVPISSGGYGGVSYRPGPAESFSVGITAAISSTACGTLTLSTVGFINGSIQ